METCRQSPLERIASWADKPIRRIERRGRFGVEGLRSASATLRPHCVPQRQRQNKGDIISRVLKGTFLKSFDMASTLSRSLLWESPTAKPYRIAYLLLNW